MATIKEIAELAGVSRGTVDRVLNNRGSVNANTAQRVREIAQKLNYRPNKAGLILAAQKKNIKIGIILFNETIPFFQEVYEGVHAKEQELAGYNCSLLFRQVASDESSQFNAMEELLKEGINGLVIAPYNSLYVAAEIDRLTDLGIPVITVNTDILSKRIAYVGSNYLQSGQTAAGLVGRMTFGDRFVGIVSGFSNILCHTERISGFSQTLAENHPDIQIVQTVENHDNDDESYQQVSKLLADHPEINVLYFTAGGVYGGCQAVLDSGRASSMKIFVHDSVPTTVELIKQNVITATICQQPYQQGYLPLDLLSRYLIEGIAPEKELNYLNTEIKIKENL